MKEVYQIKQEQQRKLSNLFTEYGVFFAFSNEQFAENKTPLEPGDKYVSMGLGGYMPKSKLDGYLDAMEKLNKWFKEEVNASKEQRKAYIVYELNNHEAFYTGDIESTVEAIGSDFTEAEVMAVYRSEYDNQMEKSK